MGGEDFACMLVERYGAYILVGNGDTGMVHHNFNDEAIASNRDRAGRHRQRCTEGSEAG